nr:hypothetical protein [Tanacetum cinerariifolium]
MTPELQRQFKNSSPYKMLQELKPMFEKQAGVEWFDLIQTFHACKQDEGKPVGSYVIKMKNYVTQLERLGYVLPQDLSVGLIMNGLTGDFASFVATPQVMAIQSGRIQKANKKSQNDKGKEHPAKDETYHHCKEVGHCKSNCPAYLAELIKKKKQVGTAIIMKYLVNISKRRAFWSLQDDILKITVLKTNTPYPSRRYGVSVPALTKDHKGNKINTPYPKMLNTPFWRYNMVLDKQYGAYCWGMGIVMAAISPIAERTDYHRLLMGIAVGAILVNLAAAMWAFTPTRVFQDNREFRVFKSVFYSTGIVPPYAAVCVLLPEKFAPHFRPQLERRIKERADRELLQAAAQIRLVNFEVIWDCILESIIFLLAATPVNAQKAFEREKGDGKNAKEGDMKRFLPNTQL